jgi:hypothetical protein
VRTTSAAGRSCHSPSDTDSLGLSTASFYHSVSCIVTTWPAGPPARTSASLLVLLGSQQASVTRDPCPPPDPTHAYELSVVPYEAGAEDGACQVDAEPSCRDGLDGASVGVPECLVTTDSWDAGA